MKKRTKSASIPKRIVSLLAALCLTAALFCPAGLMAHADGADFYLFGWIGGGNYACEENSGNTGDYKFTNGTLTATLPDGDNYVAVKTGDNAH